MTVYRLLIGIYDHKLGPICICPKNNCEWFNKWFNSKYLIQDGLNTKTQTMTLLLNDVIVQSIKFEIIDDRLRGRTLRCALFCFVPYNFYLLPFSKLGLISEQYKEIAQKHDNDLNNEELEKFMVQQEEILNGQLSGSIGVGKITHKKIDLIGVIKGYTDLLINQTVGTGSDEQKEILSNISTAVKDLLALSTQNREILIK